MYLRGNLIGTDDIRKKTMTTTTTTTDDIVAAVANVVDDVTVVLVAPATVALAAFVIALAVVTTTFLAVDAGLIFDCCVPLPPEEDHRLPPPSGKVPSWPSSPYFVDCRRRRRTTSTLPRHSLASAASPSPSLLGFPPLADASSTRPRSSLRRILIVARRAGCYSPVTVESYI